jgi:hypothetical protein
VLQRKENTLGRTLYSTMVLPSTQRWYPVFQLASGPSTVEDFFNPADESLMELVIQMLDQITKYLGIKMRRPVLVFSCLQILDVISTEAFLTLGVSEGNPLVRASFAMGSNPIAGLLLTKLLAVSIAVCCWLKGRERVLNRASFVFALVIVWNLSIVVLRLAQIA